jgi:hypothetical protein
MTIIPTFILLGGLILWFVIGTKGYWSLKMALITLTLCFSLLLSRTMEDVRGWPTDDELPNKFRVHWLVIKEPSKTDHDEKGGIYLWVTDLAGDGKRPRAYRSEYSHEKHEDAQKALGMIMDGKPVAGRRGGEGEGKGKGDGEGGGKGQGQGNGTGGGSLSNSPEIIFHELPPPKLPEKD